MASVQNSDFGEFCEFVSQLRERGAADVTPEQSVQEFRERQEKLRRWNERNAESMVHAEQGKARPLDLDGLLSRVETRLAQRGAVE
jgi:hypothetical protein